MLSENSQPKVELETMDDNTDRTLTPPSPVTDEPVATAPARRRMNPLYIVIPILLLLLLLAGLVGVYLLTRDEEEDYSDINNYAECAAAGYPIMESFPEQCATPDGRTFTRELTEEERKEQEEEENGETDEEEGETGQIIVKIYFSVTPESNDDPTYVQAVNRTTTRSDVGAFAMEQLIAGPTAAEKSDGYFTPLKVSGTSNCSGKDFSLSIASTTKIATLKFCKDVTVGGILDEARISQTVENTLKQFSTIESVVILTKDDNCFGDESGLNLCKEM